MARNCVISNIVRTCYSINTVIYPMRATEGSIGTKANVGIESARGGGANVENDGIQWWKKGCQDKMWREQVD